MATTTYVPIESKTLGSATNAVTFTSIPQTYTDLVLIINGNTSYSGSADAYQLSFNGATTGLSVTRLAGTGSSAYSDRYSTPYAGWISTEKGADIINIMNYSNTTTYKTAITRSSSQGSYSQVGATVVLWQSTNAITSVTVTDTSGNWQAGSTFTLYGIANSDIGAPKATGGIITYDNTYWYHTFGASGTFTPQQSLTADYLVVAGGGGGGGAGTPGGGGGGAGGLIYQTNQSLSATGYSITVGAGGTGGSYNTTLATNGGNSTFNSLTATGGGYGGTYPLSSYTGNSGGSGGGGTIGANGGASTQSSYSGTGFGFAGGNADGSEQTGAGGGGAGGAATNTGSNSNNATNGGIGRQYLEFSNATGTGVNGYYAGGGGGGGGYYLKPTPGTGGAGGGGDGGAGKTSSPYNPGVSGIANTGGGGGGTGGDTDSGSYPTGIPGGNGGSGVVIIRYLKA